MRRALTIAATSLAVTAFATAGCGSSPAPAQQIAPGSAVVPCARIAHLVKFLLPYTSIALNAPSAAGQPAVFQAEKALDKVIGGNVSNLDPPLALSRAEVSFQTDFEFDSSSGAVAPNFPIDSEVSNDIQALGSACGWTSG